MIHSSCWTNTYKLVKMQAITNSLSIPAYYYQSLLITAACNIDIHSHFIFKNPAYFVTHGCYLHLMLIISLLWWNDKQFLNYLIISLPNVLSFNYSMFYLLWICIWIQCSFTHFSGGFLVHVCQSIYFSTIFWH